MGEDKRAKRFTPISLKGLHTYSIKDRPSKVSVGDFSRPWEKGARFSQWLEGLPRILAARDFVEVVHSIGLALETGRNVVLAMGAHPIKVGLSPTIIDLMEKGVLAAIALNGAGIIHDCEIAMIGRTSEDVGAVLGQGRFGMAEETATVLNEAIKRGADEDSGLGEAVGRVLVEKNFPYNNVSILATAYRLGIPATVHVAVGTDIIHCHESFDGGAAGKASHLDFRLFTDVVAHLEGGVFINLGSAVILPEVFLKALSTARNLGYEVKHFTTVNMDFVRHYRPLTNVVHRPTQEGGKGYNLIGHHEIMFPLLAAAIIERLEL